MLPCDIVVIHCTVVARCTRAGIRRRSFSRTEDRQNLTASLKTLNSPCPSPCSSFEGCRPKHPTVAVRFDRRDGRQIQLGVLNSGQQISPSPTSRRRLGRLHWCHGKAGSGESDEVNLESGSHFWEAHLRLSAYRGMQMGSSMHCWHEWNNR